MFFAHLSPIVVPYRKMIYFKGNRFFLKIKNLTFNLCDSLFFPFVLINIIELLIKNMFNYKRFDVNKLNLPRQSYEKTYTANGLIDIVSKKFRSKWNHSW